MTDIVSGAFGTASLSGTSIQRQAFITLLKKQNYADDGIIIDDSNIEPTAKNLNISSSGFWNMHDIIQQYDKILQRIANKYQLNNQLLTIAAPSTQQLSQGLHVTFNYTDADSTMEFLEKGKITICFVLRNHHQIDTIIINETIEPLNYTVTNLENLGFDVN